MKKVYLGLTAMCVATMAMAQTTPDSDSPIYQQSQSPTAQGDVEKKPVPHHNMMYKNHASGTVAPCGGGSATVVTNDGCFVGWYADSLGNTLITTNDTMVTAPLTGDSTFYMGTQAGTGASTQAPLPNQGGTFGGNVRGYWFQAPVDFTMTKLYIPTDASTANSSVAVLRFNGNPPPDWSATTNDFTVEFYVVNDPTDTFNVSICVAQGEYIGILGYRGTTNSYAGAPYTSDIGGNAVTFTRMGMQYNLTTTAPQDVFSEPAGSLSRTYFEYVLGGGGATTYQATNVIVPYPSDDTVAVNICDGESYMAGGGMQTTSGTYYDSLTNVYGCDSVRTTFLTVNPSYDSAFTMSICAGDSMFLEGAWQTTSGAYNDSFQTVTGCDSLQTVLLTVNSNPTVSMAAFNPDTVCLQAGIMSMPAGTPAGGTYTGPGANGTNFDPATAGVGSHTIIYSYTDGNNCSDAATATVNVMDCTGLEEIEMNGVSVYPNPTENNLFVQLPANNSTMAEIVVFDAAGKRVQAVQTNEQMNAVDLSSLPVGLYIVQVTLADKVSVFKIARK